MIPREETLSKEEYLDRIELQSLYNTTAGIKELSREVLEAGVLSEITNSDQVIAHNLCIRKLERLGLDEEILESLIKYILTTDSGKKPVDNSLETATGYEDL